MKTLRGWASAMIAPMLATLLSVQAMAQERFVIELKSADGGSITVGSARIEADGRYEIAWDEAKFTDHFLSMRPFKCLEGPEKLWCRVPYPYDLQREIHGDDLTDLEYDLLFVWKDAGSYGIDFWNGVYYRLAREADAIRGQMLAFTLDELAIPPEPGTRPITDKHLEPVEPESHWLPAITLSRISK
ncbi:MAG: hypothetical protein MRY63_11650 [Neomegalonema sp.]|nr:hypothetical protein [Neomegalonema sp.]